MRYIFGLIAIILIATITFLTATSEKITIIENVNLQEEKVTVWLKNEQPDAIKQSDPYIILQKHEEKNLLQQVRKNIDQGSPEVTVEWISEQGKIRELKDTWQFDIAPPVYYLGTNGDILAADIGNRFRFYDKNNRLIKSFNIIENYTYNSENQLFVAPSQDLSLLWIGVSLPGEKGSSNSELLLKNSDNKVLWQKEFKGFHIRSIEKSASSKFYTACFYTTDSFEFISVIYDNKGNEILRNNLRTRRFLFNEDESVIAFFDKNAVEVYDIETTSPIYSKKLDDSEKIIIDAVFTQNADELLVQSAAVESNPADNLYSWKYTQNELKLHNYKTNQTDSITLDETTVIKPALWYDTQKDAYFYGHSTGYSYIKIEN